MDNISDKVIVLLVLVFSFTQSCANKKKDEVSTLKTEVKQESKDPVSTETSPISSSISPKQQIAQNTLRGLARAYAKPYPISTSAQENTKESYSKGIEAYKNEQWQEAYNHFFSMNPKTDQIMMYEASCKMQLTAYRQAMRALEVLIPITKGRTKESAEWYQALCHLAIRQKQVSMSQLQKIQANPAHSFSEKAKELMAKVSVL